ncbi:MAG: Nif3-like dinuclear metal center hexameric protein, partial [Thermodesulfobacteriota bacterium]|nr:Nif3-like dinuclear metal center hexameric protein [Thermodesulfobacteriota bacterium]
MVPKLKDILNILEEIAPAYSAEEWDNPGLQVGYPSQEVNKIFVALDPTLKAVEKALKSNAQLLLTHHPLIFKSLSCINKEIYPGNVISEALKKGISIVAAHTNLDVAQGGINDILANLFSLDNIEALWKRDDFKFDNAGIGRIGDLPEPMKLGDMV